METFETYLGVSDSPFNPEFLTAEHGFTLRLVSGHPQPSEHSNITEIGRIEVKDRRLDHAHKVALVMGAFFLMRPTVPSDYTTRNPARDKTTCDDTHEGRSDLSGSESGSSGSNGGSDGRKNDAHVLITEAGSLRV